MNLSPSQAKQELAKRELSRRRLIDFIKFNFPDYDVNWHHKIIAEKLEAVERGEIKRLMITLPPRHGKSEICSIQFPAWFIGRNPDKSIIATSYSSELATDFGRQVRNLVDSDEYKHLFETRLAEDSTARGRWSTDKGGMYYAVGVGGSVTGRGADVLLIDDPIKNRQDADSPVIRNSVWSWYTSTARTRLSPTGSIVIINTRWHDADLSGMILASENKDLWDVVDFPAIATQDEQFRKEGEPLWGNRYTLENLLEIKKDIGSFEWASLYQQTPIDADSQEFKKDWFRPAKWEDVEKLNTSRYITVDTAVSQSDSADYTGVIRNYVDRENKWYIKADAYKINPTELIDLLFKLYEEDRPEKIGIEKTIYLQAIKPFIDEECRKRNKFLPIVELQHNQKSKETRIRGLIPRYESKSIFHIEGRCSALEEQLLRFPKGINDDVVDALAYQSQIAVAPYRPDQSEVQRIFEARRHNRNNFAR